MTTPSDKLIVIKVFHTVIWAFLAGCVIAIPFFVWYGEFIITFCLIGIVFVEVVIIAVFGGHCPLTGVAAKFTTDRRDNFDIYLPEWLARHNKLIFGSLYAIGVLITIGLVFMRRYLSL